MLIIQKLDPLWDLSHIPTAEDAEANKRAEMEAPRVSAEGSFYKMLFHIFEKEGFGQIETKAVELV